MAKTIYFQQNERASALAAIPMTDAEWAARVKLAAAYRIFDHLGWTELIFNHITLRVPGPKPYFLINPFGLHYSEVTASNLVLIDAEGNALRASDYPVNRAGFVIHSALHGAVAQAHCVMHTHTTTGMAVASAEGGLSPNNFYGAFLVGKVAYHEFEGVTVDESEKPRLLAAVGDKRYVILRNHGLLAWGETVEEAFLRLWSLQRACDVQVATATFGREHPVASDVLVRNAAMEAGGEKRLTEDVFAAMQRIIDRKDPSYRH